MITKDKVAEIFCFVDDFCLELNKTIDQHAIREDCTSKNAIENRKCLRAR